MKINFKKFFDREFPNAKPICSDSDERKIDCISDECPKPKNHMYVNVTKGKFICHRCSFAGDYKAFLCVYYGMSFSEILNNFGALYGTQDDYYEQVEKLTSKMLISHIIEDEKKANSFTIRLPKCYVPLTKKTVPKPLLKRNIPWNVMEKLRFGRCGDGFYKGRIIIPVRTNKSKSFVAYSLFNKKALAYYKDRSEEDPDNIFYERNKKKILNPKSSLSNLLLYNYNKVPKGCRKLFVVEGVFDVARLWTFNLKAVGQFGLYLHNEQRDLILEKEPEEIIYMPDGDVWKDEEKLNIVFKAVKKIDDYYDGRLSVVKLSDGVDPDDIKSKDMFLKIIKRRRHVRFGNIRNIL